MLEAALGPELSQRLVEASELLVDRSIEFPVASGGRSTRVSISQGVIHPITARAIVDDEFRAGAATFVGNRIEDEQWRTMAILRERQYRELETTYLPVRLGVLCGDPSLAEATRSPSGDDSYDPLWTGLFDDPTFDPELCDVWPSTPHPGIEAEPSVPTLVLNGEFDLTAPRSAGEQIAAAWPTAEVVILPEVGRPTILDDCSLAQVQTFLTPDAPSIEGVCT